MGAYSYLNTLTGTEFRCGELGRCAPPATNPISVRLMWLAICQGCQAYLQHHKIGLFWILALHRTFISTIFLPLLHQEHVVVHIRTEKKKYTHSKRKTLSIRPAPPPHRPPAPVTPPLPHQIISCTCPGPIFVRQKQWGVFANKRLAQKKKHQVLFFC